MQEDEGFVPVHVSRIQRAFRRLGTPGLYKGGLRLLHLLREVEPLHGGYWLPTPYRVFKLEDEFVFIGAIPSALGLLGDITLEGLARLLTPDVAGRFLHQSLDAWMDAPPRPILSNLVAAHTRAEAKTSNIVDVTYFNPPSSQGIAHNYFQWSNKATGVLAQGKIAICRQSQHNRTRYFSARLGRDGIASEAPLDIPVTRLLFAIAHHAGTPVKVAARSSAKGIEVTVGERLPIEEFRLALLLSREIVRTGRSTTFLISPGLAPAFCARLVLLGCDLETQ